MQITGESVAKQVCTKVTSKLNFFLLKFLRRVLCNTFIQPHFDYVLTAWYPNINKKYKNKLQLLQNNNIRFCLQLDKRQHIGTENFDKIIWLPIDQRFKQCLSTSVFKFFSEIYEQNIHNNQTKQYCYQKFFFKTLPTAKD